MSQWDIFVNGLKEFFNSPVPIIGCTIGFLLVFALTVLSKTSIGRKALKQMKSWYQEILLGYRTFKEDADKKIKETQEFYEIEHKKIEAKHYEMSNLIVAIAENTHNEKIKSALIDFKDKVDLSKTDFEEYLNKEVNKKVEEAKAEFEDTKSKLESEYHEALDSYKAELDGYKSQFDELVKKYENIELNSVSDMLDEIVEEKEDEKEPNTDSTEEKVQEN